MISKIEDPLILLFIDRGKHMNIIRATEDQFQSVRSFYHSMIDALAGSTVYVGWKKDIYPAPEFLSEATKRENCILSL